MSFDKVEVRVFSGPDQVQVGSNTEPDLIVMNIGPKGDTGATGNTGPAGPNSVTSATTSDGTADLDVASLEIYPNGSITYASTNSGGAVGLSGQLATDYRNVKLPNASGNLALVASTTGQISFADISDAETGTADLSIDDLTVNDITATGFFDLGDFTVNAPTGQVIFGSAAIVDFSAGSTISFDSISYTYGTGAAAAHRTALGLTTLATTTPGTNVANFLEFPTSANLASALTDENGTGGGFVRAEGATLTTPTIAQINGGTAANDDLTLQGTTNETRTTSYVNLQPNGGNVGIGTATPSNNLQVALTGSTLNRGVEVTHNAGGFLRMANASSDAGTMIPVFIGKGVASNHASGLVFTGQSANDANGAYGVISFSARNNAGTGVVSDSQRAFEFSNYTTPLMTIRGNGNVGIGTTLPNTKAALDITSTTKGFLPPRMTTAQRDAIASVPAGLMIYNTTTNKLNVYTTAWEQVTSA